MNRRSKKTRKGVSRVITVILTLILCLNLIILICRLREENQHYTYEYSTMMRDLKRGDYPEVVDMIRTNETLNTKTEIDTAEFSAFADFYEAAILYRAFCDQGKEEKAQEQLHLMQEARNRITTSEILEATDHLLED